MNKRIRIITLSIIALPLIAVCALFLIFEIFGLEPRDDIIDGKAEVINNLIFCKEKLGEEMAWNPSINYNYVFYFKKGSCPPPNKLENVEEIRSLFCAELKEKKSKSYHAAIKKEICPEI